MTGRFMTIGSLIDKRLVLWPDIWGNLRLECRRVSNGAVVLNAPESRERLRLARPVQWRSYYDFGDPIAFEIPAPASGHTVGDMLVS